MINYDRTCEINSHSVQLSSMILMTFSRVFSIPQVLLWSGHLMSYVFHSQIHMVYSNSLEVQTLWVPWCVGNIWLGFDYYQWYVLLRKTGEKNSVSLVKSLFFKNHCNHCVVTPNGKEISIIVMQTGVHKIQCTNQMVRLQCAKEGAITDQWENDANEVKQSHLRRKFG